MSENPYEASDVATDERQAVLPMTITWLRIRLAAILTSAIMLAVFTTLAGFTPILSVQFDWTSAICRFLGVNVGNATFGLSVAFVSRSSSSCRTCC